LPDFPELALLNTPPFKALNQHLWACTFRDRQRASALCDSLLSTAFEG